MRSLGKVEKGPRINPGFDHIWRRSRGGGVSKGDRRSSQWFRRKTRRMQCCGSQKNVPRRVFFFTYLSVKLWYLKPCWLLWEIKQGKKWEVILDMATWKSLVTSSKAISLMKWALRSDWRVRECEVETWRWLLETTLLVSFIGGWGESGIKVEFSEDRTY